MGGAPLLLAIAVVTVDAGWESDGRDGYRYIIQIPAEQLHEVERTGQITSQLPEALRGRVSSVVVKVGDAPLPRPDVPPADHPRAGDLPADDAPVDSAPESADASQLSATEPSKIYLPSPDETVRAQGDANGFGLPGLSSSAPSASTANASAASTRSSEVARLAVTDRGSRVESPPPGGGANSYGTSQFNGFGFETQSRGSSAAPSTSASGPSSPTDVPSTSRSSSSGAASNAPATGFAAADGTRDNRWFTGPQSPSTADGSTATAAGPSTAAASSGTGSSATATPPASNPANSYPPASNAAGANATPATPPAARQDEATSAPPPTSSPWALPQDNRSSTSNPPSLSGSGNGASGANYSGATSSGATSSGATSSGAGAGGLGSSAGGGRADQSPYGDLTTAEERQRAADRRLLEEVGIDASGHAYDKRTNQPLYENDERYPLIVDYVRRMEQAEKNREQQRAAPLPGRSVYDDRIASGADRYPPAARMTPPAAGDGRSGWGYDPSGYDTRGGMNPYPNGYAPAPTYNQNPNYAGYGPPPAAQPPAGNWQPDPRLAQNPPAGAPATPVSTTQPTAPESRATRSESPSDAEEPRRTSKTRDATVKTQPLFMFLLLLSIVGNIYLGIAISRLIRRYRNLVSTHRGTTVTA